LTVLTRKNRLNTMVRPSRGRTISGRTFSLFTFLVGFVGVALLFGIPQSAAAQEDSPYLYVTEWQIPHSQWTIWEAFEASSFKPMFEKLLADRSILGWGFYAQTIHTPDGPTHGIWFSSASMAGVDATLNGMNSLPANSVMSNPQVKQRDFLFRSLATAGRAATGSNATLWVHRTQSAPGKPQNLAVWDKYVKPMLDGLVGQGTILSYGIESEQIHTEPDGTFYIYCLMPGADATDKFFAALDAMQSKMTATERNEFNATQLTGQQERLGHVTFFALAGSPSENK
jgi:hypothetical protein